MKIFKILFLIFIVAITFNSSEAWAANFVIGDWRVLKSYLPEDYALNARALSVPGSQLLVSADLFLDQGKGVYTLPDYKDYTFRWFVKGVNIGDFTGSNQIIYGVDKFFAEKSITFLVQIFGAGRLQVGEKQIVVPVSKAPQASVHLLKNNKVSFYSYTTFEGNPGDDLALVVKPYFFNVANLFEINFDWFHGSEELDNDNSEKAMYLFKLPKNPTKEIFSVFAQNSKIKLEFVRQPFYLSNQ